MTDTSKGILAIIAACSIWGLSPLFYKYLSYITALEVLAHRTVWSFFLFAALLVFQGRFGQIFQAISSPRKAGIVLLAALFISANWGLFIWAIQVGRATESSLGYYIFPLFAVLLGFIAFGERLSRAQWMAVGLATIAVLVLTIGLSVMPWISLVLASTFAGYGLVKKRLTTGPVVSVTAEVLFLVPVALIWLVWLHMQPAAEDTAVFGRDLLESALLTGSGLLTALPLILFSYGAQRVAMATVGLVQYLNPTLQFLCAVVVFGEPFGPVHLTAFALIWAALAIYSISAFRQESARRKAEMVSEAEAVVVTKSSSDASAKP